MEEQKGEKMGRHYVIFSALYLPNLGGVERFTYNLAKKLLAQGDQVTVVTSNVQGIQEYENTEGIEVFRMPCFSLLGGRFPVIKKNGAYRKLEKQLKTIPCDFVIVNTRYYLHSLFGVKFAKKRGVPCITIEHGTSHLSIESPLFDRLGQWFEHFLTSRIQKHCHHFYGVSQNCCRWLTHFGIDPEGTVYNAIDLDQIQSYLDHPVTRYREELKIPPGAKVIAYTGRLVREKGVLSLMEAVRRIHEQQPDVFLLIAGDGDLRDEVEQGLTDYIFFLGKIDFPHVVSLLKETDVFCLPTVYPEGFPTSVLEAAACRCFVVTTDRGGSKELIQNDSYGKIMEGNSPEEVYQNLMEALSDDDYRKAAIEKSYQRLTENFTWEIVSGKVRKIADTLCQSHQ